MTNPSHLKVRYLSELPELPPEEVENSWMYSYVPNGPDKDYKVHLPDVVEGSLDIIRDELLDPTPPYGSDMVSFRADGEGAVTRSVRDKLGDVVSVKDFGAVGDGISDDTLAMQQAVSVCAANNIPLVLGPGIFKLSKKIVSDLPIGIFGAGDNQTILRWGLDAESEGLEIYAGGQVRPTTLENLRIETAKGAEGTGVKVDYSSLVVNGTISPRAETHLRVRGVTIRGSGSYTSSGWNKGIEIISVLNAMIDQVRVVGRIGTVIESSIGISFTGEGRPVQLYISNSAISVFNTGIYTSDAEGIYVTSTEIVNVNLGVNSDNAVQEPLLSFIGNHIAARTVNIKLKNVTEAIITNNDFYAYPLEEYHEIIGVQILSGCDGCLVSGNLFNNPRAGFTKFTCVSLEGGARTSVHGNIFSPGTTYGVGIHITGNSQNNFIGDNQYRLISSTNQIVYDSSYKNSVFKAFPRYSGDLSDISTSLGINGGVEQCHVCTSSASGGPDGVSLSAAICKTFSYNVDAGYQVLYPASREGEVYFRRKVAGSFGDWYMYTATAI